MKKVLMIAFHYPPYGAGTGMHRTLKFSRYLSGYGWQPIVLTASLHAHPEQHHKDDSPPDISVCRAFALDSARHLSVAGSHSKLTALPDRWVTWWPAAVAQGLALIRKHRPEAIWSTYPIPTAHLIGLTLHRWTGLPWIADLRDPMINTDPVSGQIDPVDPLIRRTRAWVENQTMRHCTRAVFTTPGTLSIYAERFPKVPHDRWCLIPNGYDEEDFLDVDTQSRRTSPDQPAVLVHSGELYRTGRNALPFLRALADLQAIGKISSATIKVVMRGTADDDYYRTHVRNLNLDRIVSIEPAISHKSAVAEMLAADGLLLMQGARYSRQIPAKVYEYLRSGRPIFAMADAAGDTAALLKAEGVKLIVPLESEEKIADGVVRFLHEVRTTESRVGPGVERHSRRARTAQLATVLDSVCTGDHQWQQAHENTRNKLTNQASVFSE